MMSTQCKTLRLNYCHLKELKILGQKEMLTVKKVEERIGRQIRKETFVPPVTA